MCAEANMITNFDDALKPQWNEGEIDNQVSPTNNNFNLCCNSLPGMFDLSISVTYSTSKRILPISVWTFFVGVCGSLLGVASKEPHNTSSSRSGSSSSSSSGRITDWYNEEGSYNLGDVTGVSFNGGDWCIASDYARPICTPSIKVKICSSLRSCSSFSSF